MPRHTYPRPTRKHSRLHLRLQVARHRARRLRTVEHEHIDTFEFSSDLRRRTRLTLGESWGIRFLCDPRNRFHRCGEPQFGRPQCRHREAARQLYDYFEQTPQAGPVFTLTVQEALRLPREARDWLGVGALCHLDDRLHRGRRFWEEDWELPLSERSTRRKRRSGWRRELEQDESQTLSSVGRAQSNGQAAA